MVGGDQGEKRQVLWKASAGEVCGLFEKSLRHGSLMRAEDMLDYVPEVDRLAILFGLLQREIFYRRESSPSELSREEYERRFPDQELLLDALLDDEAHLHRVKQAFEGDEIAELVGRAPIGAVYKVRRMPSGQLRGVRDIPALFVDQTRLADCRLADLTFMFHRNLARPFELIEAEGDLLLVTEYVEGPHLVQLVTDCHPLPLEVACEIVRQAADGLAQVHDHFRCHGDLRPQNLMLDGGTGVVKVTGLGLTELLDLRFLRYATTPAASDVEASAFRPPELGQEPPRLDQASDVYGFGCTLYYALTGSPPRPAEQGGAELPAPLHELRDDCPRRLEAVVTQMVATLPQERYASATQVRDSLGEFADPAALARWWSQVRSPGLAPGSVDATRPQKVRRRPAPATDGVAAPAPYSPQAAPRRRRPGNQSAGRRLVSR